MALLLAAVSPSRAYAQSSLYEQLQALSQLVSQIRQNYVDSIAPDELMRGAIDGILGALDPHSYFLTAADAEKMALYRGGRLGGPGMTLEDADGLIVVQSVERRGPAERVGIQPGDRVVTVDGKVVRGLRAQAVEARLIGERGQRVAVGLERGSRFEPESIRVRVRLDDAEERSVGIARQLGGGLGYVRLDRFGAEAARELRDAIGRATAGGERRLILDLRGNPGGYVHEAVEVAELFLTRGQLVFATRGRHRESDRAFMTAQDGPFRDMPVVVLLDERSASAAEALAGSLQDHDRAWIMGHRSFGKALVQRPFLIQPRGDVVMLTIAWVVLPSGRFIQRPYRGQRVEQYLELAGRAPGDSATLVAFRTAGGRIVRGGGGITPDASLPEPPALPAWWTAAADSGFQLAVADSAAATLPADPATLDAWMHPGERWMPLLEAFLARTRARLRVGAAPDSALAGRMARALAMRVVEVRWGRDAADGFRLRHDPDVHAASDVARRLGPRVVPPSAAR